MSSVVTNSTRYHYQQQRTRSRHRNTIVDEMPRRRMQMAKLNGVHTVQCARCRYQTLTGWQLSDRRVWSLLRQRAEFSSENEKIEFWNIALNFLTVRSPFIIERSLHDISQWWSNTSWTRKRCTGQVLPSAKYRPTRLVVDAALRRIGKSRHGGHKIANISVNCQRISPMDSAYFPGRSGG